MSQGSVWTGESQASRSCMPLKGLLFYAERNGLCREGVGQKGEL